MARKTRTEKRRNETRISPEEDPEFQIAPLIDILLVLLVFFMSIASTEVLQSNKNLVLPVAKNAQDPSKDNPSQAIVNVLWPLGRNQGMVEIDTREYPDPGMMVSDLQARVLRYPELRVLIRADRAVQFSYMREILKAVGDAGIANVTFSAIDKEMSTVAPAEQL